MALGEPSTTPLPAKDAHRRSLAKAFSWRVTGSIDTFLISWVVTGQPVVAATISAVEVFTKVFLFYMHERAWGRIRWGQKD
jgi:uncharacterized membrane protein